MPNERLSPYSLVLWRLTIAFRVTGGYLAESESASFQWDVVLKGQWVYFRTYIYIYIYLYIDIYIYYHTFFG